MEELLDKILQSRRVRGCAFNDERFLRQFFHHGAELARRREETRRSTDVRQRYFSGEAGGLALNLHPSFGGGAKYVDQYASAKFQWARASQYAGQSHVGQMFDLRSAVAGEAVDDTLLCTDDLHVTRIKVAKGEKKTPHASASVALMYCVEGRLSIYMKETEFELAPGKLLYLEKNELHTIKGLEESILLVVNLAGCVAQPRTDQQIVQAGRSG